MRIAVLSSSFLMGGLETRLKGIFKHINHDVYWIAQNYNNENNLRNISITKMDVQHIKQALLNIKPDIVDIHPFSSLTKGAVACMQLGIPYLATIHGIYADNSYMYALDNAKVVFVVSEEVRDQVLSFTTRANMVILRNAVDLEQFTPFYNNNTNGKIAIISRIDGDKYKGIKALLDSTRLPIDVIGTGNKLEGLRNSYLHVNFLGYRDIADYFGKHGHEYSMIAGMGRVVLEGIAMGYPVLLLGYDGVKGPVTTENFTRLSYRNFSGRGEKNVRFDGIISPDKGLRKMLYENHDELKIAKKYLNCVESHAIERWWMDVILEKNI